MRRTARIGVIILAAAVLSIAGVGSALAYDETAGTVQTSPVDEATCGGCHDPFAGDAGWPTGVHGGYTITTSKCAECHVVHDAPTDSSMLLPAATIKATCETCHDGTQGRGVYGAIAARGVASDVKSGHRIDITNVVPGGDAGDGGDATMTFSGESNYLTCTDCHSPHASNTVDAFIGDRTRAADEKKAPIVASSRLLKQNPGGFATAITEYGSDWCLACHQGRAYAIPGVHNHPSDFGAGAFTYSNVAILNSDDPTTVTVLGSLGGSNRGYLMPWVSATDTRTAEQIGHLPICQQCHEDARDVGTLSFDGDTGDAAAFSRPLDGTSAGNPRFQNFPHESTNPKLLVETKDDLCLNCHTAGQLN